MSFAAVISIPSHPRFLNFIAKLLIGTLFTFSLALQPSLAKSTNNPNDDGWQGKGSKLESIDWKPRTSKCAKCQKIVAQYNSTMTELLSVRFSIEAQNRSHRQHLEKLKSDTAKTNDLDSAMSGAIFGKFDDLNAAHEAYLVQLKQNRLVLEKQAHSLQLAIADCERTQCNINKNKDKQIKIGGENPAGNYQPDISELVKKYGANWQTPNSHCPPCKPFVDQLNIIPNILIEAEFEYQRSIERLKSIKAYEEVAKTSNQLFDYRDSDNAFKQIKKADQKIKAIIRLYKKLIATLAECEQKYCSKIGLLAPNDETKITLNCSATSPQDSIEIGANSEVGSRAQFKDKAKKKVSGLATKAITGLLGVGGGGGGSSQKPNTYKDPIKKKQKIRVRDKSADRDFYVGGKFMQEGLLISNTIQKAPDKGTFHEIYIQNPRGWKLAPIGLYMYEIWRDWKLNVSWTRDTYIDGELVKHEQGGWSESWSELLAKGEEIIYGEVQQAPLWEQLGFNTAVSGARSIGTLLPISPSMLTAEQHQLVVHISVPKSDPVITYPYVFDINLGDDGSITLEPTDESTLPEPDACNDDKLFSGPTILPTAPPVSGDSEDDLWITTPDDAEPIPLDLPTMPPACPNDWVCQPGKICPPIENCTIASNVVNHPPEAVPEDSGTVIDDSEAVQDVTENDTYSVQDLKTQEYGNLTLGDKPSYTLEDLETYANADINYGIDTQQATKVGIALKYFQGGWLPTFGDHTLIWAKMYVQSPNNPNLWLPDSNVSRKMHINFIARSNERGKAMNANIGKWQEDAPDLYFQQSRNTSTTCSDDPTSNGHFGSCKTEFEENEKMFVINSDDFGGFSRLDVSCEGCVPLKIVSGTFPEGTNTTGSSTPRWEVAVEEQDREKRAVYVPKDDNRNQIADAWPADRLDSPTATQDTDGAPIGNGAVGDGFSAYEEYRGFLDRENIHHRTDLKTKNLFIQNGEQIDTSQFDLASGLDIIEIEAWQHRNRVINFNSGHANLVDQHGVIVRVNPGLPDRVAGRCECGLDRPKTAVLVSVAPGSLDDDTTAHELGHAVGMRHHGEAAWASAKESIRVMTSGLGDLLPGRVHSGPTLCGETLPHSFWIGTKGDQGSGHEACIMRYNHAHYAYEQEGEDYDCMPYVPLTLFDTSPAGTGPNGFDRNAGDATRGNCMAQIWINSL